MAARRLYHIDETIIQIPKYEVSKAKPRGNPNPQIVADLKKKLHMK